MAGLFHIPGTCTRQVRTRSGADRADATRTIDAVRREIRARQLSLRTEEAYSGWVRRYLRFHRAVDPRKLGSRDRERFLTHLAVVLTTAEVRAVLGQMRGTQRLVATLLHGSGMRLLEYMRLRAQDLALEQEYPNAGHEWAWQWVFPGTRIHRDSVTGRSWRHHLHESSVQRAVKEAVRLAGWGFADPQMTSDPSFFEAPGRGAAAGGFLLLGCAPPDNPAPTRVQLIARSVNQIPATAKHPLGRGSGCIPVGRIGYRIGVR